MKDFAHVLLPMIRRLIPSQIIEDIITVQPMDKAGQALVKLQVWSEFDWTLPHKHRPVYSNDDVTVLLIMGYTLAHGHNVCCGFGNKHGEPMPYWLDLGEEDEPPCTMGHIWEVNFPRSWSKRKLYYYPVSESNPPICYRCKIEMKIGEVIDYDYKDERVRTPIRYITYENLHLVRCWKCLSCGHSEEL